jgi:hypothetical protein
MNRICSNAVARVSGIFASETRSDQILAPAGRRNAAPKGFRYLTVALFGALLFASAGAQAQSTYYVRPGATGANNGSDWSNAFSSLPSALIRGARYFLADGSYGGRTLNTPNIGTSVITIKKCTPADHGTEAGYNSTYCDGQATFGDIILGSDFWVIDGSTRDESNWANGSSYGFVINGGVTGSTAITSGVCASYITVKYVSIGGADVGNTFTNNEADSAFKSAGFSEFCVDWTLSRNYVHNTHTPYHINGSDVGVIEYSYIAHGFGKEAIRGQIRMSNFTIRHNIFKDSCQGNPADPTGGACTAVIALFDGSSWVNTKIYGNVFYNTTNASVQDAIVVVGGLPVLDAPTSGAEIYNNTFAGFKEGALQIQVRGSGACRNNLSYNMAFAPSYSCSTASNNSHVAANPFVNYSAGNFRLATATAAGVALTSPYNVDMLGNTRGVNAVWDIGAFEFGGTAVSPLLPPINLVVN